MTAPLFGSTELARRIERAEATLVASGARAAGEPAAIYLREFGGGVASWSRDGSPFNKVAGLGFEAGVDDATMEAVEQELFSRGSAVQVELANLGDPAIGALLTQRGYRLVGFENVLGRALAIEEVPAIADGVAVATAGADEFDLWLDTVVDGFAHPDDQGVASHEEFPRDVLRQVMRDLTAVEGFAHYLARLDGAIAGGGSLRVAEGVAQLAGAATLPAHRRKGVQSSLLAARLHDACLAGCDVAVVTTQPGSRSQQNVQRQGFHLLYTRAVLVKEAV
ncbi:MAG: GNAT family N-acetyltransferase [Thermoanaerobaculia bacterium]